MSSAWGLLGSVSRSVLGSVCGVSIRVVTADCSLYTAVLVLLCSSTRVRAPAGLVESRPEAEKKSFYFACMM